MKAIHILYLLIIPCALCIQSCRVNESQKLNRFHVDERLIESSRPVETSVSKSNFLGAGSPDKSVMMAQAKDQMLRQHPGKNQKDFTNVEVDYEKVSYLLFSKSTLTIKADLIEKRNDGGSGEIPPTIDVESIEVPSEGPKLADGSRPHFIINARWRNTDWSKINPWIPGITAIRVPGGNAALYTWGSWDHVPQWLKDDDRKRSQQTIITDEVIQDYKNFIADKDVESYWVLNINDKLENQLHILDRCAAEGITFTHLEIGCETYLPRFALGHKEGFGFAHKITLEDYVDILDEWIPALRDYGDFKILVVVASRRMNRNRQDQYRELWNNTMFDYIEKHPDRVDGLSLHIYAGTKGGSSSQVGEEIAVKKVPFDYYDTFPLPIHLTEGGHGNVDWTEKGVALYKAFHREMYVYLRDRQDGSRYGTHVLFNVRDQPNHPYPLYDVNGITPLGVAAMEFPYGDP